MHTRRWHMLHDTPHCITRCRRTVYNILQHIASHCNTLQQTATHCNTLHLTTSRCRRTVYNIHVAGTHYTTHYKTHYVTRGTHVTHFTSSDHFSLFFECTHLLSIPINVCGNTLQHTATHCNTLQGTATHYIYVYLTLYNKSRFVCQHQSIDIV